MDRLIALLFSLVSILGNILATDLRFPASNSRVAGIKATPTPVFSVTSTPSGNRSVYPGAREVSSNEFTSPDSPEKIFAWYKDFMSQNNFNVKTSVFTKSNDDIKAVIKASGISGQIDIIITRAPQDQFTTIKL